MSRTVWVAIREDLDVGLSSVLCGRLLVIRFQSIFVGIGGFGL